MRENIDFFEERVSKKSETDIKEPKKSLCQRSLFENYRQQNKKKMQENKNLKERIQTLEYKQNVPEQYEEQKHHYNWHQIIRKTTCKRYCRSSTVGHGFES